MVLGTGRTTFEVFAHSGDVGVGVGPPQLQLDVAIELREAFLATQFGPLWSEQPAEQAVLARVSVIAHRRARRDSDATSGAVWRPQYDFLSRGARMRAASLGGHPRSTSSVRACTSIARSAATSAASWASKPARTSWSSLRLVRSPRGVESVPGADGPRVALIHMLGWRPARRNSYLRLRRALADDCRA